MSAVGLAPAQVCGARVRSEKRHDALSRDPVKLCDPLGAEALLAKRLRLPPAAALLVGGAAMAFAPGLPPVNLDPDLVLSLKRPQYWVATRDKSEYDRRTIYMIYKRNLRLPFVEVFEAPDTLLSCARREQSTHAPQALELLNGQTSNDLAAATAHYAQSRNADDLWYSRTLAAFAGNAPTILLRIQAMQQAIAAGERATRTAEAPFNAWYSLSTIRAGQNDAAGTERCLRAAIAAHPTWFKPHWTLAQVLRLESRGEEARREAALAADLDGGKHPEVMRTLQELGLGPQK